MTMTSIILAVLLASVAVALTVVFIFTREPSSTGETSERISIGSHGSIVTVRKAGNVTSVDFRGGGLDHWEGDDNIKIPPPPVEETRRRWPDLYAEYVSEDTPPLRRREIADDLYAMGFTLPYIPGLYEQCQNALRSENPGGRRVPVNLTPKDDQ